MPSASGLMRLSLILTAIVAAGIVALVTGSALIPAETVRAAVISELRAVTGLEPTIRGAVTVSLFPTAVVTFTDVSLGTGGETPALTADRLNTKLQLLPLLIGRIRPADMTLTRPRITVAVEPDGSSNWSPLMATLARTLKPGAPEFGRVSFSEIRVSGGTILVTEPSRAVAEQLSDVELSFAWPSISPSFGASGRFVWRGETFDASANAADLVAALSGDRSGLKVRLAGNPFRLAFEGNISQRPTLKVEGTLSADGKSLREVLRWSGRQPLLPGSGFGPFALKSQVNVVGGSFLLSGSNIELDGNVVEGVLAFTGDPRATMKGTLAADTLDLTPYAATVDVLRSNDRDWSQDRIGADGFADFDIDLRLSAAHVTVAGAKLGRAGIGANLHDGRLTIAIGEMQAYGGVLKGGLVLGKAAAGVDFKSQLQFADVDLESCLGELFGIRRLEGKGNLALAVEASGNSAFELVHTLSGSANLTARQGAITGFNAEQLLKRLEQRPLSIAGDFRRGRTPFDKLDATVKIAQGNASVEAVRLEGGAIRVALGGFASIASRDLDLKGTAALVSASSDPVFELPFVVQGPWDDPIMLPDAQLLISRSGAAAPLLEAVRDRKTRDAVRSVIERLSREGLPAVAPSAGR